jgi:hypothetical protein
MGEDIGDECLERFRLAFGLDLDGVRADIAYETADIVARRGSADRIAKENTLNDAADL